MDFIQKARGGDVRALARLITWVENGAPEAQQVLRELYPETGKAHVLGLTGPPGSGKSTLIAQLVKHLRRLEKKVAVLAVDPSSPFTGGALLGDRIRMSDLNLDEGVFIRSMGARGNLGGLAATTSAVTQVLDACAFDYIFIETVGVGQSEVDIMEIADTTLVLLVPGLGDDIQAIKAGILEIGDIFVVNKADREGATRVVRELQMMVNLKKEETPWPVPILLASAIRDEGTGEILQEIKKHFRYLQESGQLALQREKQREKELWAAVSRELYEHLLTKLADSQQWVKYKECLTKQKIDPYTLSQKIVKDFF